MNRPGNEHVRCVVADPPWPGPVGDWRSKPLRLKESLVSNGRKASANVYNLMSLDEIYAVAL